METSTVDDLAPLFFEQGDEAPDVCFHCKAEVTAKFDLRTVRLEQSGVDVPDVLVAVCPQCDRITSIPSQSEPRLREARERVADEQLGTRVTHAAEDAFRMLADTLGAPESALRSRLLTYYLRQLRREPQLVERICQYAHGTLARGRRNCRFAARVQSEDLDPVLALSRVHQVNQSDLTTGIIGLAFSDLLLDGENARAHALRAIADSI